MNISNYLWCGGASGSSDLYIFSGIYKMVTENSQFCIFRQLNKFALQNEGRINMHAASRLQSLELYVCFTNGTGPIIYIVSLLGAEPEN